MTDDNPTDGDAERGTGRFRWRPSRRRFLEGAAVAGAAASFGGVSLGQETTIRLVGRVTAWQGAAPAAIEGQDNPTLTLEPGTDYTVEWENADGQPHNFAILDGDGNAVVSSEVMDEQGATQTVTFTASEEMSEYVCEVHPTSMRGNVDVGGGQAGGGGDAEAFIQAGPSVGVQQVAGEPLVHPTAMKPVPGEDDTRMVLDQLGQVYLHEGDSLREEPALDVSDRMEVLTEAGGGFDRPEGFDERGLLGLAFHPDFQENRRLYLRYSAPLRDVDADMAGPPDREGVQEDFDHTFVLAEFQAGDDLTVDPGSEQILLELPEPQFNHNAGDMAFGPDGYLYVPTGDGGDANDTGIGHVEDWYDENDGGNAQNLDRNLLGSMLRIDVDAEGDDRPYGIPEDNPFVGVEGAFDETYAYGFRNPWRMSFDSEGRLFVADVGQNLFEEVNLVERGGNYGWNVLEGTHCFSTQSPNEPPEQCPSNAPEESPYDGQPLLDPIVEYPHSYQGQPVGISVTGGYVYEGDALSEIQGQYVFGDWSRAFAQPRGRLFVASPPGEAEGGATGNATTENVTEENVTADNETVNATADNVTAGNDTAGNDTAGNDTAGNETNATGNATAAFDLQDNETGNETATGAQAQPEDLWTIRELVVEGNENGEINRFIQSFGRGADGALYVLASTTGRLTVGTGEIYRFVPAGEGEGTEPPEEEVPTPEPENETETNATADNQTANATAGNETAGNGTAGNETNATDNATGNASG
jgi:glucose/arabinose dehydrogenase/plastocyanin